MHDPVNLGLRALILAPVGRDAALTRDLLGRADIAGEVCRDMESLCGELARGVGVLVVAEEALQGENAGALLGTLETLPPWSDPPLILLSARGGSDPVDRLAARLDTHANLMLLERPLRPITLVAAVQYCLRARQRQYETRDLLLDKEKAVQQRDRFLATLSHELRNPLGTILTMLAVGEHEQSVSAQLAPDERQVITRQARHLSRLIDDLLDVSRVTAGKIVLQSLKVDLKDIARRSVESLQPVIRQHRHSVTLSTTHEAVWVMGDPTRLEQVVTNLVNNAIKYTPDGGSIDVIVGLDAGWAKVQVRDNGIGIPPSLVQQVFEPFTQLHASLHRAQGGLGLGLALVRGLVEMQGGTVGASSEGPGKGSVFTVRLPLTTPPVASDALEQKACASAHHRVLLVEDGEDARRAMARLLNAWGYEVEVAGDGEVGLEMATAGQPRVALIDIGLPKLDGYEVARRIRSQLGGSIFLIALTGYGQPEDRQRTVAAGFDLHLVKPVDPGALREILGGLPAAGAT